ncbi:diaminopimelate decarboxylase [Anaerobranca californiensis DSM 14826]|jgi:diaminopimelate decarboxylase|uniref:Diaminopimelate decarboxylase n=1 Tax=Anaerobranca californiensis DSM 14826 TaxID=1120989 RepID=A0A1M6MTT1_9FIRM|nr:diaminopimelate decarboxylase [Anaerobranca californiensis]SHJ86867.1 diaminopimelate decarboxylase [Anaerobranca californiensis DSM 14826]
MYIQKGIIQKQIEKNFIFDNIDTVALAKEFGTPLYVISENIIRSKCSQIRNSFLNKYPDTKAAYASKAFLTLAMCKIIESEGLGLDVVSGGELFTAISANFPMGKVMFHGNNKSYEELKLAVTNSIGRIIVDNFYELEVLQGIAKEHNKRVKILFRISPGVPGKTHKFISTGQTDSKFGISIEENSINLAFKKVLASPNLKLMGFHFHIGSQLFDNRSYINAIEIVTNLMKDLKEKWQFTTEELNIGGGFGIGYSPNEKTKPISYYVDPIMKNIENKCNQLGLKRPTIIIEPGRWIVGEAGITLYTIGSIKEIPNVRTYISVDGGLPDNPRPALYGAKYSAVVANRPYAEKVHTATIAGKSCESGDILIWDLKMPHVKSGDILAVLNTGAYNYSMASNYNRLPKPGVVLISNGKPYVIVEREKYEDLISKDKIPNHLL